MIDSELCMMCDRVNCGLWLLCEKRKRFEGCVVAIDFVLTLEDFVRQPRKVLETMAKGKRENKRTEKKGNHF